MSDQPSGSDRVVIEMTASRLVTRTMLRHLIADDRAKADAAIEAFGASIDALTSSLHGSRISSQTHAAVVGAVRRRATCMIEDLRQILAGSDAH
jgi:hypothetical protein